MRRLIAIVVVLSGCGTPDLECYATDCVKTSPLTCTVAVQCTDGKEAEVKYDKKDWVACVESGTGIELGRVWGENMRDVCQWYELTPRLAEPLTGLCGDRSN